MQNRVLKSRLGRSIVSKESKYPVSAILLADTLRCDLSCVGGLKPYPHALDMRFEAPKYPLKYPTDTVTKSRSYLIKHLRRVSTGYF
jgi:hypothetical protein